MIHPSAVIETGANIGNNVQIGPFCYIGSNVTLDDNCIVAPSVVITGHTTCGKANHFFQFTSIGEVAQDKKYNGEPTKLIIGDNNVFRENVTVHRGTMQDKGVTLIGSNNLFMAYAHVAHDAIVGNHVIFSNAATVGGHVQVGDWAIISGGSGVHQFCKIGAHAFVAGYSGVVQDVLPFVTVAGRPTKPVMINVEGMKRCGFSPEDILAARRAYKTIYRKGLKLDEAIAALTDVAKDTMVVQMMLDAVISNRRGIAR
jgi:UDP-N-acetylglucosamine acyltransferase